MRQDEELWIKKMKEVFSEYSEPLPPDGWSKLEKELQPKRRVYPLKWWGAAAAILLLALSGITVFFMNTPIANEVKYTSIPEEISVPDTESIQPQRDLLSLDSQPLKTSTKPRSIQIVVKNPVGIIEIEEEINIGTNLVDKGNALNEPYPKNEADINKKDTKEEVTVHKPSDRDKLHLPVRSEKNGSTSKSGWSLGLAVNSGTASSLSSSEMDYLASPHGMMDPLNVPDLSNGMIMVSEDEKIILKDDIPYLVKSKEVVDAKHHQPITFGVTVRKKITDKLSLESGFMYTLLSSDIKLASNPFISVDQKLHYLGIPLKANWDFISSKRFTLYTSAGGAIERCIYGKIDGKKNTVNDLQFSLLGAVGAQYNVSNRIGLYVEPGVSYFFDDGSDVETIRKDKPFNINLQAGIRFTY